MLEINYIVKKISTEEYPIPVSIDFSTHLTKSNVIMATLSRNIIFQFHVFVQSSIWMSMDWHLYSFSVVVLSKYMCIKQWQWSVFIRALLTLILLFYRQLLVSKNWYLKVYSYFKEYSLDTFPVSLWISNSVISNYW